MADQDRCPECSGLVTLSRTLSRNHTRTEWIECECGAFATAAERTFCVLEEVGEQGELLDLPTSGGKRYQAWRWEEQDSETQDKELIEVTINCPRCLERAKANGVEWQRECADYSVEELNTEYECSCENCGQLDFDAESQVVRV